VILEFIVVYGVDLFTYETILAYIGIAATAIVAFWVYRLQQSSQEKMQKIINSPERRRQVRITWLEQTVGQVLKTFRKKYELILERVEAYQENRSEENLEKIVSRVNDAKLATLPTLRGFVERDIGWAREYISNPRLALKFQDSITVFEMQLNVDDTAIRIMNRQALADFIDDIKRRFTEIDEYIEMIEDEKKALDFDPY
jgi:hypothetical protein